MESLAQAYLVVAGVVYIAGSTYGVLKYNDKSVFEISASALIVAVSWLPLLTLMALCVPAFVVRVVERYRTGRRED